MTAIRSPERPASTAIRPIPRHAERFASTTPPGSTARVATVSAFSTST
jgi:hypothetical protein